MNAAGRLSLFLVCLMATAARAENWPRWRGPDGNAVSTATSLPSRWSRTENVRWHTEVPGEGSSSPIVWDERVFITSALDSGKRRVVHCLDRANGKRLWSREVADQNPETASAVTGHAASTPVTDGTHVVAWFANAGLVCYDFAGKLLWRKQFGEFDLDLGLATSPILHRDRIILVCDHDGDRFTSFDSFLIALDVKTGQEVWKTSRQGVYRSWSTPVIVSRNDKSELIVNAQEELRGYDADTGKPLWRLPGLGQWVAPSPVQAHGLIFVASGKNGPLAAVKPGGTGEVKPVWRHETGAAYVCSPLVVGDYLYVHTDAGILTCYEARTGKAVYKERLEGKFTASAVAGDGKLYFLNEVGTTLVVRAGPKFELLAKNALGDYAVASPAIARGQLFLRTERHLFCIAAAARKP
ncbi:MAG: PQQ-binding-like beta-propeller repeat protein [Planctomycetia bacterium]|nr:PQQ-binding-like beta-propeller repeat protein [Planctomycetia bacterium]